MVGKLHSTKRVHRVHRERGPGHGRTPPIVLRTDCLPIVLRTGRPFVDRPILRSILRRYNSPPERRHGLVVVVLGRSGVGAHHSFCVSPQAFSLYTPRVQSEKGGGGRGEDGEGEGGVRASDGNQRRQRTHSPLCDTLGVFPCALTLPTLSAYEVKEELSTLPLHT